MGSTSGSCTLQEQAVAGTTTLTLPTFNGTVGLLVSGTAVSASGTAVNFTGIPAGVRRITVMFNGVSFNGSSDLTVQLGDAGGIETTGYAGNSFQTYDGGTVNCGTLSNGVVFKSNAASTALQGSLVFTNLTGNIWTFMGSTSPAGSNSNQRFTMSSGSKTLSDTLTQVRIASGNGTDTFDAGSINILYE
jgi:hypothetical protein